ncbi:MAG: peptidoglycan DD-metalloendopeptidase family protein [Clostridium sp.]
MISKNDGVSASIKLALSKVLPLFIIILISGGANDLEAYINNKIIYYAENNGIVIQGYSELIDAVSTDSETSKVHEENISNIEIQNKTMLLGSEKNINKGVTKSILNTLTRSVNAYEVNIDGENFGYVNSEDKANSVLPLVTNKYIESLNIEKEDVISANVDCKIDLKEAKVGIDEIKTKEEISEEIYDTSITQGDLLNIEIKVRETNEEEISAGTTVIDDDSMYLGQIQEVEGESGKKLVHKEVTYNNGEVIETNVLKEDIIAQPKNTVIHKGSRNPYNDGIAFLNRPTRGGFTTSDFGARWESFHKGIDIAGNIGDDVMAAIDGEVIYAQYNNGGYGNLIMLKHEDEMVTYYAHLNNIYVSVGDKVEKGEKIGAVGNTGFSTGPHLHFELRVNDNPVNPANYIVS